MDIPDIINGCFELFGGGLLWLNVKQLLRDKRIQGIHWLPTGFFSAWGLWNLFYYYQLDQFFSWFGGMVIVSMNIWWLILVALYNRRAKEYA